MESLHGFLTAHWDHELECGAPNSDSASWHDWIAPNRSSALRFMGSVRSFFRMHWEQELSSAAFRPQTPLPVEGARRQPKAVEVLALLRPEGRAPEFRFMARPDAIF